MTGHLFLCVIIFLTGYTFSGKPIVKTQPDQIVEIFRHGARGPNHGYDSSWNKSEYGVLTPVGMRQQYVLGRVLANKYSNLLGPTYDYNTVYMLADKKQRCVQSALSHIYGIYSNKGPALRNDYPTEIAVPPFDDPMVKEIADSLDDSAALLDNYLPAIVDLVDSSNAYIFQSNDAKYCPNNVAWQKQNLVDEEAQTAWRNFSQIVDNINKHLDKNSYITDLASLKAFGEVMLADVYDNRTLPGNITDPQLITNITHAFSWIALHMWCGYGNQSQLFSFGLLDTVLGQIASFKDGISYNKVAMYAGHDDNIFPILSALGVVSKDCLIANFEASVKNTALPYPNCYFPYFGSNLIFEFYNDTENPTIEFYYNNVLIQLCDEKDACAYNDFVSFIRKATGNLTLDTYFNQCGYSQTPLTNNTEPSFNDDSSSSLGSVPTPLGNGINFQIIIIITLSLLLLLLVLKNLKDNRKHQRLVQDLHEEKMYSSELHNNEI